MIEAKHIAYFIKIYKYFELTLPLGFRNWITTSSLKILTSSIAGMAFTPILFRVL